MVVAVSVFSGDITQYHARALITAVNAGGVWFGGIDKAIRRVAGHTFHYQLSQVPTLRDGQVFYAPAMDSHRGLFGAVLFVVDELEQPLDRLILRTLREADELYLTSVSLPAIRTGVMTGEYEQTVEEALNRLCKAVADFVATRPQNLQEIKIVVYDSPEQADHISRSLKRLQVI